MNKYNLKIDRNKLIAAPELPKEAQLPVHLELDGCPWLDLFVEFCQKWSPRSFYGYFEATALWVLSVIAARRIAILFGGERYTNLYILLVGRTSIHAKSTTVQIGKDLINKIGLSYLLLPDESTPQRMIQEMSAKLPDGFNYLHEDTQEFILRGLAFAGQRGWYYDEFGQNIQNMMKRDGPYSEFRGVLRKFDDTEPTYSRATITRGTEVIDRPYLALLGILTPADIAPVAYQGSMLWGDGYFARMGLIVPPIGIIKNGEFPEGERIFEESILKPLTDWHNRLGIPKVEVLKNLVTSDCGQSTSTLILSDETRKAYYRYDNALRKILVDMSITDLDGNYARFPEKALRIAALFASLSGSDVININHWAKAQAITERWRSNLHSLYMQVNTDEFNDQKWTSEQKVLKAISEKVSPTSREIQQYTGLKSDAVTDELDRLIQKDKVISEKVDNVTRFRRK